MAFISGFVFNLKNKKFHTIILCFNVPIYFYKIHSKKNLNLLFTFKNKINTLTICVNTVINVRIEIKKEKKQN